MSALDENIFGGKTFSGFLEEIYMKHKKRDKQIETLINELKPLIKDVGDATLLVPLLADYLDMGLKNDDQLVKIATIVQRIFNNQTPGTNGDSGFTISAEERKQLEKEIDNLNRKKDE